MRSRILGRGVSALVVCLLFAVAAIAQIPSAQHVILVIDENSSFSDVLANMPWLVSQGNANGYATNYKSDNGGSLLDYLWLASGSCESSASCVLPPGTHDFNCNGNDCYYPGGNQTDPIADDNIFREMNKAGITWKVYAQSYAAAGGTPLTPDNANGTSYYRRHNGATWYSDILSNVDGSANNIVDLSQLEVDLANGQLPRFVLIVPDGNHDAHDCPVGMKDCSEPQKLAAADEFLSGQLDQLLSSSYFQPGGSALFFVTFDECGGGTDGGCGASVYAAIIGPTVAPHTVSATPYKHENMLRTMLDALGITTYPGAAATAAPMSDFFSVPGKKPLVTVAYPSSKASISSPVTLQAAGFPTAGLSITGWYVYVDGNPAYQQGALSSINPAISIANGKHTLLVRTWDSSGAYGDQTLNLTVSTLNPTLSVATPANKSQVGSPVNIIASASPTAGHTISGWWVYVDGNAVFNAGPMNTFNANVGISPGAHSVKVRAWDSSGSYADQTLSLTTVNKPAVAVAAPTHSANVISPMNVQASATPSKGQRITGWYVYVDGKAAYNTGATSSINANIQASAGSHTVLVRAWDSSGVFGDQTLPVAVSPLAVNITTPLAGGISTSPVNIQAIATSGYAITSWVIQVDSMTQFEQDNDGNPIDANLVMAPGQHTIQVQCWDSHGNYGSQTINVTAR